jgi:hypothetical protein
MTGCKAASWTRDPPKDTLTVAETDARVQENVDRLLYLWNYQSLANVNQNRVFYSILPTQCPQAKSTQHFLFRRTKIVLSFKRNLCVLSTDESLASMGRAPDWARSAAIVRGLIKSCSGTAPSRAQKLRIRMRGMHSA